MSSVPVSASSLSLALTLDGENGKKFRLTITGASGLSLSLQELSVDGVSANESVVDLASLASAAPEGGTEDDPLTVESSSESEISFGCEECHPEEPVVAAEEPVVAAEEPETEGEDDPEDEPEEDDASDDDASDDDVVEEIMQPFAPVARHPHLTAIPRMPLATVNGITVGTRRSARTRTRFQRCVEELDSDEDFDEVAGFSQEIYTKKNSSKK